MGQGLMDPDEDDISLSSVPSQLTTRVNWSDEHHRRSVAACLVKGVYVLERDRQKNRQKGEALAPRWWQSFQFESYRVFTDEKDDSIFGAIYKFNGPFVAASIENAPPQYVIAFRGTVIEKGSIREDIKNNIKIAANKLHLASRFKGAMKHVLEQVSSLKLAADNNNVWFAGHSQGSAIALLVGNRMITNKKDIHFQTFLFNPPFISSPIDLIENRTVKHVMRVTGSVVKAGLAKAAKGLLRKRGQGDSFDKLSEWKPNLFVNPGDPFCNGYIEYFRHRGKMEKIGAEKIERLATKTSIRSLISYSLGRDSEPFHLIPSAYLTINLSESKGTEGSAHALQQWWNPNCQPQSTLHTWKIKHRE